MKHSVRTTWVAVAIASALAGCAATRNDAATARDGNPGTQADGSAATPAAAPRAHIGRGGFGRAEPTAEPDEALPSVELTSQILYQLLASEVAVQRGQPSAAAASYLTLARQTRDPRLARRAVELALAERSLDRAAAAAQIWLETSPNSKLASQTLETLYLTNGQYTLAEPLLAGRLAEARTAGTLSDVYPQVTRVLLRSPDRTASYALIERVAAPDSAVPEAWLARAALAHAADDFTSAMQASQRAVELKPDSEEAVVAAARYAQRTPDGTKIGITLLRQFLAKQPKAREARFALGRLYASDGSYPLAREQLERLLAEEPNSPATLFTLAQIAYQAKQPREAEKYLLQYVQLPSGVQRDDGMAYLFLAQLAEDEKRLPQAIDWLGRIESGEQFLPALVRRAVLLGRLDRLDDARALLHQASVSTNRDRVQLTIAEAQILRDANRQQDAFDVLDRALEKLPNNPDLLYEHALTAERLGRIDVMETGLRKLIELRPDHAHAHNALGYSLADRNMRLPEALALIEKALSLAPDDAHILDSMGWVHFRMGNLDRALEYLHKAYKLRPEVEIAAHLGEVLWAAGRTDEARRLWRDARVREPNNETLNGTLARLNVAL